MGEGVAAGMIINGFGTIAKGMAEKQHGDAVKAASYMTADGEQRAAADALDRGSIKELQFLLHGNAEINAQSVRASGSGGDMATGGAAASRMASIATLGVDLATVRRNAALDALGFMQKARRDRQYGENAQAAGNNAEIGTFLSGIAGEVSMGGKMAADTRPADTGDSANIEE